MLLRLLGDNRELVSPETVSRRFQLEGIIQSKLYLDLQVEFSVELIRDDSLSYLQVRSHPSSKELVLLLHICVKAFHC